MITVAAVAAVAFSAPTIENALSNRLDDISFTVTVQSASRAELRKISPDFALGYEAKETRVQWKEPMMIRLNMNVNGENAYYIINGFTKTYNVPRLGIRGRESVANAPGKHQTLMEFGLLSRSMMQRFLRGTYVRTEGNLLVFDLNYQYREDPSRNRIWVDPQKRYITKRMSYTRTGELKVVYEYSDPVERNGVWVPTKATVRNADNKVAGVTQYSNITVNSGIPDSVFRI